MILTSYTTDLFIIFVLTLVLLGTKAFLVIFLGKELYGKYKSLGYFEFDFLFAFFILMVCLLISRIFYVIFDFVLTQYTIENYVEWAIFWKLAGFIGGIGLFFVLLTIERAVLNYKLKAIPSIIILLSFIVVLVFPVNEISDFQLLHINIIFSLSLIFIVPIIFIYMGIRAPEIRKVSFILSLGVILFLVGLVFMNEFFLYQLNRITTFFLFILFKLSGLILISYSATNLYIYNYFMEEK
ncbi:MAG: membrane protein of unknown function [Promethearchaeota archaeon]|nr:MAG: membrane protein of unknown function [Candidatus Lokiarchaeota archaeon]